MRRVFRYLKFDTAHSIRTNLPHISLVAIFIVLVLTLQSVIASGISRYAHEQLNNSALKLIEMVSFSSHGHCEEIYDSSLKKIAEIEHVENVYPYWQFDIEITDEENWADPLENPAPMWATPAIEPLMPTIILGEENGKTVQEGHVILPSQVPGGTLNHLYGKTISFSTTRVDGVTGSPLYFTLTVQGIYDNTSYNDDGSTAVYMSSKDMGQISQEAHINYRPYPSTYVDVEGEQYVTGVQATLAKMGFESKSIASQMSELGGLFALLESMVKIFDIILVIVILFVGFSIGRVWIKRKTQLIGTLRATGWTRAMVSSLVLLQTILLGLVIAIVGVFLSVVISLGTTTIIAKQELTYLPINPWSIPPYSSILLVLILVPFFLFIGTVVTMRRISKISPDDAMRSTS